MPTGFTPIYKIVQGSTDITDRFNDRVISIEVELKGGDNTSDTCSITVDDRDRLIDFIPAGKTVEVYLGYREIGLAQMGLFEINMVSYAINPAQIEILGNSVGFRSELKAPANQNYENKTLGEIIGSIASQGGKDVYVSPGLRDIKIPFVNQNASPLHLLGELERRFGALAKVEDGRVLFLDRDDGETASGLDMPIIRFRPGHFGTGVVIHSDRGAYGSVKVGWIDPQTNEKKYAEETDKDAEPDLPTFLSDKLGRTEGEAKFMAKSQLGMLRRSVGELQNAQLAKGDPWIRDQQPIELTGFRVGIDGSYVTDQVRHTFTKDTGITTTMSARSPGTGETYTTLPERQFLELGQEGVVGQFGPQLPGTGVTPAPAPTAPAEPDVPLNT